RKVIKTIDGVVIPEDVNGFHFIYLIYDKENDEYKIGETKDLLERRLTIKRPTADLEIIHFEVYERELCIELERQVIDQFSEYRISGDWFKFPKKIEKEVIKFISKYPSGF